MGCLILAWFEWGPALLTYPYYLLILITLLIQRSGSLLAFHDKEGIIIISLQLPLNQTIRNKPTAIIMPRGVAARGIR